MPPRKEEMAGEWSANRNQKSGAGSINRCLGDRNGRRARYCGTRVRCERAFGGAATPTVWPPAYAPYPCPYMP